MLDEAAVVEAHDRGGPVLHQHGVSRRARLGASNDDDIVRAGLDAASLMLMT